MRPSNTIGKHTRANSHATTICKGKNRCTDSNLSLESLSDLFGEEEYRAWVSVSKSTYQDGNAQNKEQEQEGRNSSVNSGAPLGHAAWLSVWLGWS